MESVAPSTPEDAGLPVGTEQVEPAWTDITDHTGSPIPEVVSIRTLPTDSAITVRNAAKRELDVRLVKWGQVITTLNGLEMFSRGAFAGTDPDKVRLMGLEHEASIGLGQNGEPQMIRIPVGKGLSLDEKEDAAYMTFRVAQTSRGDEVLALAQEGIASGVSIEFAEVPQGSPIETRSGRRLKNHQRVRLHGASTTYQPAYEDAVVMAVRTKGDTDVSDAPVAEAPKPEATPERAPALDITSLGDTLRGAISEGMNARSEADRESMERIIGKLEKLEEQSRASFAIPAKGDDKPYPEDFRVGDWAKLVLRTLTGEQVSKAELQARTVADLITTDNLGVVPAAYLDEMIGIIDKGRPFLESTRRINTPASGMTFNVPTIVTKPTTGKQSTEKSELASTTTSISNTAFTSVTVGGYGDISLQLLKRSDPSYLEMYIDLLSEQYAIDADDQAVDALLAEGTINVGAAGVDPADGLSFGSAWENAATVSRLLRPDTIWLSTAAVKAFIDAKYKTDGSNANSPLYSNLVANFTAGQGVGGSISGLRPVYVPALDDENADILVGPSRAFAWAEDGTYTLQVDVPAKAGRDVGLVGMLWFMPLYPAAFTWYWLSSS